MTVLAGSPPSTFYGLIIALPYFALRFVQRARAEGWWASVRAAGPATALAGVTAVVLGLPNLLSTAVLTRHSVLAERGYRFVAAGSLSPSELVGLFFRSGTQLYFYVGLGVMTLALLGLRRASRRDDARFFAIVAVVGVVLALGSSTHLLRWLHDFVPGFSLFRLPFRYLFLTNVGLAVLAAWGIDRALDEATDTHGFFRGAAGLVGLLGLAAVVLGALGNTVQKTAIVSDVWLAFLFLGLLVLALSGCHRFAGGGARDRFWRTGFAALALSVLFLDLSTHAQRNDVLGHGRFVPRMAVSEETFDSLAAESDEYRVWDEFALRWRAGSRLGLRDFRGYMDPLRLQRYAGVVQLLKQHPHVVGLFNVRTVLQAPHPYHGNGHRHLPYPSKIKRRENPAKGVYRLLDAAPFAYWAGRPQLVDDDAAAVVSLPALHAKRSVVMARADLDAGALAWVEALPATDHPRTAARIVARSVNGFTLEVDAPADGLLVVNEAWFPGWRAEVDGEPTPLLRANSLVQALPVTAGAHRVELAFRPAYFLVPAWIALVFILFWSVALVRRVVVRRRA